VQGRRSLNQRDPGLFGGRRVVADAAGNDEELARTHRYRAAVRFGSANAEQTTQDKEHLVLVFMAVPGNSPCTLATLMY
jgi:hypothetical protein